MEMEDQERALLEAESEEEETLEAESTEGALSISRIGRNFLTDRELLEAENLQMTDPSGYTSAEADVREAILRERVARNQELQAGIDNELVRQRGIQHRIESDLSAEDFKRTLRNLIEVINQRRARLRARYRPSFDREVEEMHASIEREVEERRRRDREDEMRRDREYEEESNNELRLHRIEHDDAYASYIFTDVESANEVSSRVLCGNCQGTGLVVDALWVHSRTRSAVCSLCDGSGNIMR